MFPTNATFRNLNAARVNPPTAATRRLVLWAGSALADGEDLTGNVLSGRVQQRLDECADLFRVEGLIGREVGEWSAEHPGVNRAGRNTIDADAALLSFLVQGTAEGVHECLGAAICGETGERIIAGNR